MGTDRDLLRTMAFGVALFTLLIQATSMSPLVRRLGIITTSPLQIDYAQRHARLTALRSAEAHIEHRYKEGLISTPAWEKIKPKLQEQIALLADSVHQLLRAEPKLEMEELDTARREILRAQRSAYLGMRGDGVISEEVYERLSAEADAALEDGGPFWFLPPESFPERLKEGLSGSAEVEEIQIEAGAACDGKPVKDVLWPKHFVIASLRRGTQVIIPKGNTILWAGDTITVIGDASTLMAARRFCSKDQ
jgi:NhaP-type Na+/H+ and K+/H+ antiporter